ncbi:MAG: hypothetical protein V5804_12445 [Mucilaginibacter sp.]|uniref:hypothetical protein n=1 Tax=Mucilaginibacter sp. TaxID=1882438 RepID=UPI0034E3A095
MIDSGGGLGLRNISFAIIFLFAFYGTALVKSINRSFILLYFIFLISLVPGLSVSLVNPDVSLISSSVWIISFLLIPVFFLYIYGSKINKKTFVISGTIFAGLIITLFVGRVFGLTYINNVNDYIKERSNGFFGNKNFLSGDILPNVYFQGTLSLIICGVLCFECKNYFSYLTILIALILAPSRFGFVILLIWALIVFIKKSYLRIFFVPFFLAVVFWGLYNLPFGKELIGIFNGQSDGLEIRNGHIQSVFDEFKMHPIAMLTGEGPGSLFYSKGYGAYVDNIELSQFEYLRKYGIISFIAATFFYFWPLLGKKKNTFFLKGALIMYYFVSFSNPVLYSIFAMLFLTYTYVENFPNTSSITPNLKATKLLNPGLVKN